MKLVIFSLFLIGSEAGKLVKPKVGEKKFNNDGLLIGPGNCVIIGEMVHECDGSIRHLGFDEKQKLKEQRELAEEDFRQHLPSNLPPCFPFCQGFNGEHNGQANTPFVNRCQNQNNEHNVNFDYKIPPCFPFCTTFSENKNNDQQHNGDPWTNQRKIPPCFPFCKYYQKRVTKSVYSPCHSCQQ